MATMTLKKPTATPDSTPPDIIDDVPECHGAPMAYTGTHSEVNPPKFELQCADCNRVVLTRKKPYGWDAEQKAKARKAEGEADRERAAYRAKWGFRARGE
jgi:hypothetical protein